MILEAALTDTIENGAGDALLGPFFFPPGPAADDGRRALGIFRRGAVARGAGGRA